MNMTNERREYILRRYKEEYGKWVAEVTMNYLDLSGWYEVMYNKVTDGEMNWHNNTFDFSLEEALQVLETEVVFRRIQL